MDNNTYMATTFPNPMFTQIGEGTGIGTCITEIDGQTQCFLYGFESYGGSLLFTHSGCFPSELACLSGILKARLAAWDMPLDLTQF